MSKILKAIGAATGNPLIGGAGGIAELLGFRGRRTKSGRQKKKKSTFKRNNRAINRATNNAMGFRGRRTQGGGARAPPPKTTGGFGGPTVQTVNAPVAFARNGEIKPLFTMKDVKNGIEVHSVDYVGVLAQNTTINTFTSVSYPIDPTDTSTFPYLAATIGPAYEKFKLKKLILHYSHFCPTSLAGSVLLWWSPDVLASLPGNTGQVVNDSNSTEGAVYEDLSLEVDLSGLTEDWQFVGTATNNRLNCAGVVVFATDKNPAGAASVGDYYIETVWEFVNRKLPSQSEPVSLLRKICGATDVSETLKRKMLHDLVERIVFDVRKAAVAETEEEVLLRRLARVGIGDAKRTGRFTVALTPTQKYGSENQSRMATPSSALSAV